MLRCPVIRKAAVGLVICLAGCGLAQSDPTKYKFAQLQVGDFAAGNNAKFKYRIALEGNRSLRADDPLTLIFGPTSKRSVNYIFTNTVDGLVDGASLVVVEEPADRKSGETYLIHGARGHVMFDHGRSMDIELEVLIEFSNPGAGYRVPPAWRKYSFNGHYDLQPRTSGP